MTRKLQIIFVFVSVIFYLKFFDARFMNDSVIIYLQYLDVIIVVFLSVPYIFPKYHGFVFPVQLILVSIIISIFMSYIFWDQGFKDSLIATLPYLILFLFFYLLQIKFPIDVLEKIIVAYGVIYILLYFFQFAKSPTVLFGKSLWGDEFTEVRGVIRIIFPGGGFFILSSCIAINKLTSEEKNKWFWLTMSFFGILIPILQVTRQFIICVFLIYLYHAIRYFSITKKVMVGLGLVLVFISIQNSDLPIIKGIRDASEHDIGQGKDYIRVLAGEYFLFDFSPNDITHIFGNGVPYWGLSEYGFFVEMLSVEHEFFLSDVGIIAVYAMFGVLAIFGYVAIWSRSFIVPLPKEFQYLKYYLWIVLFTSFTWYSTYHYHYLLSTVFVVYMYHSLYKNQKRLENFVNER